LVSLGRAVRLLRKTAVSFLGSKYSCPNLDDSSERFAVALAAMVPRKGDRIVTYIPNFIAFVVSWLAKQRLGEVAIRVAPIYTSFDLKYITDDTGVIAVVCGDHPNVEFCTMLSESKVGKLLRREIRNEEDKRLET
jgi:acyl-CoA synthetase (AMP-forming)/AMP-acid ligase II